MLVLSAVICTQKILGAYHCKSIQLLPSQKLLNAYHHKNIQRFPPQNLLSAYHHKKIFSACLRIHVSIPSSMTKLLVNFAIPPLAYCPGKVLVIFKKSSCYHACSGFRHMQIYETATFCYEDFCCRNWLANS